MDEKALHKLLTLLVEANPEREHLGKEEDGGAIQPCTYDQRERTATFRVI